MSGFAGFVNYTYRRENTEFILKQMTDTLIHRGSDIEAYYSDENLNFGYRCFELKNIEEKKKAMAKQIDNNEYVIIYDGKIHNREELVKLFKEKEISVQTEQDEELLINGYFLWNEKLVNYIEGVFSFVIWDRNKKELYMARDKLGIKSVFYTKVYNELIFASEIKALLKFPGVEACISEFGIAQLLGLREARVPGKTVFKNICELNSGSYLKYSNIDMEEKGYWDIDNCMHNNIEVNNMFEENNNINKIDKINIEISKMDIENEIRQNVLIYDVPGFMVTKNESNEVLLKRIIGKLYEDNKSDLEKMSNLLNSDLKIDIKGFIKCKLRDIDRIYKGERNQKNFKYNLYWKVLPYLSEVIRVKEYNNNEFDIVDYNLIKSLYDANDIVYKEEINYNNDLVSNLEKILEDIINYVDSPILDIINFKHVSDIIKLNNKRPYEVELMAYLIKINVWMEEYRVRIK